MNSRSTANLFETFDECSLNECTLHLNKYLSLYTLNMSVTLSCPDETTKRHQPRPTCSLKQGHSTMVIFIIFWRQYFSGCFVREITKSVNFFATELFTKWKMEFSKTRYRRATTVQANNRISAKCDKMLFSRLPKILDTSTEFGWKCRQIFPGRYIYDCYLALILPSEMLSPD